MAIQFYCGSPGAGKSYHVVRYVIIPALLQGRNILTNLPLKLKEIYLAYPDLNEAENYVEFVDNDKIKDLHKIVDSESYAKWLIVIDEAHDYWPSHEFIRDEGFRSWISLTKIQFQYLIHYLKRNQYLEGIGLCYSSIQNLPASLGSVEWNIQFYLYTYIPVEKVHLRPRPNH